MTAIGTKQSAVPWSRKTCIVPGACPGPNQKKDLPIYMASAFQKSGGVLVTAHSYK